VLELQMCASTPSPKILFIFINMYSLYRENSLCQFPIALHCTLVTLPPPCHFLDPLPTQT
jgi:hypothetical protein